MDEENKFEFVALKNYVFPSKNFSPVDAILNSALNSHRYMTSSVYLFTGVVTAFYYLSLGVINTVFSPNKGEYKSFSDPDITSFGKHENLSVNGISLHAVCNGRAKVAPLILLLHGYPENWFTWRDQLKLLSKDYYVVAVDLRGYGISSKPLHKSAYSRTEIVRDITELIVELGYDDCILIGNDWGGIIAQAVAEDHPNMVKYLILSNTLNPNVFREKMTLSRLSSTSYMGMYQLPLIPNFLLLASDSVFIFDLYKKLANPGVISEIDANYMRKTLRINHSTECMLEYYRALLSHEGGWTTTPDRRKKISPKTLVIWGEKDEVITFDSCFSKECFEDPESAFLFKLNDCGHFVHLDNPELFSNAVLTFVK
ncbi:hypothetical protein HK098_003007 [Nowakowskiella sp. JEL0407]|nr:hypothetical protein HK098_003007 [Nowakowskiella sp. JEL0407]